MSHPAKPRHLWPDYAAQFTNPEVASAYKHRPPCPEEAALRVVDLLEGKPGQILELGAGSGDFTSTLAYHVDHITAVEPSEALRSLGEKRTASSRAQVQWIPLPAESFRSKPRFDLVVAAESLHWMDWESLFPTLKQCLLPGGMLVLLDRVQAEAPAWEPELLALIRRHSTNQHYEPFDLPAELDSRGLFRRAGHCTTADVEHHQPTSSYIESFHSRNGFSRARMTKAAADAFLSSPTRARVPP